MNPWADPLCQQARSDFAAAEKLRDAGGQVSQTTMLLWMAWEKMAKALLVDTSDVESLLGDHGIAKKFLQMIPRVYMAVAPSLGLADDEALLRGQDLHASLVTLESLLPHRRSKAPNMEYPWEVQPGQIMWPARDLTDQFCSTNGAVRYLWKDFATFSVQFDEFVAVLP